jgi:hypothetical protein
MRAAEFGGQKFFSFKDGSYYFEDEVGRRPRTKAERER